MASIRVCLAAAALAAVFAGPARSATARWFVTPGPDGASCEIDVARPTTSVYCLVYRGGRPYATAVAGELTVAGRLRICHGLRCIGNTPEGTPTLAAGRSLRVGPFRCTSRRAGVRCVVVDTGRGFSLGADGVVPLGR